MKKLTLFIKSLAVAAVAAVVAPAAQAAVTVAVEVPDTDLAAVSGSYDSVVVVAGTVGASVVAFMIAVKLYNYMKLIVKSR